MIGGEAGGPDHPYFDNMAELFDRFTEVWDVMDDTFHRWLVRQLGSAGRHGTGSRAVDLGCGAGRHVPLLAQAHDRVLGIDVSRAMLGVARARRDLPNVEYRQAGVLDLDPARDGRFDTVLSVNALYHAGDPVRVAEHVRSLVAPGGRVIIADIVDPGGWDRPEWHVERAFTDARAAYRRTGDAQRAATMLRLLLDPSWLRMVSHDRPLSRTAFHDVYRRVFPAASFNDELPGLMAALSWSAPDR